MKRHIRPVTLLSSLFVAIGLLTGCDLSYTVVEFWICNESGQTLYVESNIVSALTSDKRCFTLEEGDMNAELLAKSPKYQGFQSSYMPLSNCINNEGAKVSIFTIGDNGEKHLVRSWNYSDRNNTGRELFSESCLSQRVQTLVDGGCFPSFTFIIQPEDLESN